MVERRWAITSVVLQDRAGDGYALLLAAGKLQAALSHRGLIAIGQLADELVNARELGRGFDLFAAGAGAAVGDVIV